MKTDYEFLKTDIDGHILTVTINRPERMNALHPPAHAEFDEVWNEFDKDEDLWVGIITGEGDRAFSAGNDLKFQAEAGGKMDINMASSGFAGLTSRFNLTKPLIAAVNGVSMGGGFAGSGAGVAYCWHGVEGYSKFSSYEGNGNSDGPFIYTGFKPRLMFFKNIDGTSGWTTVDTGVYPNNTTNGPERIEWNSGTASVTGSSAARNMDLLANGVKLKTTNSNVNTSGQTYVFGAWAEVPFRYNNTHP